MEERKLRSGFTTGTCAACAAKAAAVMLLKQEAVESVQVMTPGGTRAELFPEEAVITENSAVCAVRKDAGDDPDVTDKALIYASVEYIKDSGDPENCYQNDRIFLTGGQGVGIVTKPGLACPVGFYAINPVPRKMIFDEVEAVAHLAGCEGGLLVRIWIPEGERLALSTFNPKLGIEGGISVLGTSGIVEPMSESALKATIQLELHMKAVEGQREVILTPGNYGENFLRETLKLSLSQGVQCSNFVRESVLMAADEGMDGLLFVGHIGKLIKVAGGVGNTHSKYGDRRMEIMWDCARSHCGKLSERARSRLKKQVLDSNTTEEAVRRLNEAGMLKPAMETAVERIRHYLEVWSERPVRAEVVTFTNGYGILGMTRGAVAMIDTFRVREKANEIQKEQEKR